MPDAFAPRTGLALLIAIGALAAAPAGEAAGIGSEPISCAYHEAGLPGPEGNVLRIDDETDSATHIYREDDAIRVFSDSADKVPCSGAEPTVFNVDRIEYTATHSAPFIGYLGNGTLAPGASPEPAGAEIEVHVHESYRPEVLNIAGSAQAEAIVAGALGPHRIGVNLNAQDDGSAQDADVILDTVHPAEAAIRLIGRGGRDTISALGRAGFTGILPAEHELLSGGPGDDTLVGGPHDDRLSGLTGNDVLLGGRGRDRVTIGPGRDLVKAGKGPDEVFNSSDVGGLPPDLGPDRVFGGGGNDLIEVDQGLPGDRAKCGGGRGDRAGIDPGDRATGCETVDVIRR
jgi:hypothetical protein